MKKSLIFLTMILVGFGSMALLGAIVDSGKEQPKLLAFDERPTSPTAAARSGILDVLLAVSADLSDGKTSSAARWLDSAKRICDVARSASPSDASLKRSFDEVERARVALQDHDPRSARTFADGIISLLADQPTPAADLNRMSRDFSSYDGAAVLNVHGRRIGELSVGGRHDAPTLTLVSGGASDVFGFLDVGGTRSPLRPQGVLLGEHRRIGATMVMTFERF